jgi:hypothetical protein
VEKVAVSGEPGLRICIGDGTPPLPGFRMLGSHAGADIHYAPDSDLPFPDRAADVIVWAAESGANLTHLLLECRRVLRPQGVARVGISPRHGNESRPPFVGERGRDATADADGPELSRLAAMMGLEAAERAPVAGDCRRALAALPLADRRATREFTKRDRRVIGDPLVSILIPAYSPRFFAASLDSALAQTYENIEIVVCDDSGDSAIEEAVGVRATGARIRYERNATRLGVRANYRRCFERARGEFVKFLCDDDLLAPTCVATLLDSFRHAPDVTLATSHRQLIDAEGRRHPDQPATTPIVAEDTLIAGHTLVNAMLMVGLNVIGEPSTTLFRKAELIDQAPQYFRFNGEEGHGIIDMVMWSALLLRGDAVYRRESLSCFRIHPGQRQHDPAKQQRNVDSIHRLRAAWLALGLHERIPQGKLLAKPFPPPPAEG